MVMQKLDEYHERFQAIYGRIVEINKLRQHA